MIEPAPSHILLLDDSDDDALLIRELLHANYGEDLAIDHAKYAAEATALADAHRYSLYLIDYMLAEPPTGAEWIAERSKAHPLPPVIMLTGLPDAKEIEAIASKLPAVSYFITKDRMGDGHLTRAIASAITNRSQPASTIPTILIADDDADDVLLMEDALLELNRPFRLDSVGDGVELMEYLQTRPHPGLILLDLNMPRMDGRQVLDALRNDPQLKRIPVVVMSTSTADIDINNGYDRGANSYVCKPSSFDALVTMMEEITDYWFELVVSPTAGR